MEFHRGSHTAVSLQWLGEPWLAPSFLKRRLPCRCSLCSFCQQVYSQSSVLKSWENGRKWLCKMLEAQFATWQRLGRGRFLGAKWCNSYTEGRPMGTASQMQKQWSPSSILPLSFSNFLDPVPLWAESSPGASRTPLGRGRCCWIFTSWSPAERAQLLQPLLIWPGPHPPLLTRPQACSALEIPWSPKLVTVPRPGLPSAEQQGMLPSLNLPSTLGQV